VVQGNIYSSHKYDRSYRLFEGQKNCIHPPSPGIIDGRTWFNQCSLDSDTWGIHGKHLVWYTEEEETRILQDTNREEEEEELG